VKLEYKLHIEVFGRDDHALFGSTAAISEKRGNNSLITMFLPRAEVFAKLDDMHEKLKSDIAFKFMEHHVKK